MSEPAAARLAPDLPVAVYGVGHDGSLRWSFAADPLSDDGDRIVLRVYAGDPVDGPEPWTWPADGEHHFWRSRHYSVLVTTRAGRFPYWYCPVHTPAVLRGHELSVTDLGLNVQLFADGRYSVGGGDEFEADSPSMTPEERGAAQAAVDEIVRSIKQGVAPFPKPP